MTDFSQIDNWAEIEEREAILEAENTATELREMADMLEAKDFDGAEEELIEMARECADHNPVSEHSVYLQGQLMAALEDYR